VMMVSDASDHDDDCDDAYTTNECRISRTNSLTTLYSTPIAPSSSGRYPN